MKKNLFSLIAISIALTGVGVSQASAPPANTGTHYSHSQLRQMIRDARTPEQYSALADYYAAQQTEYAQQAAEAKQEWIRRSQNVMVVAAKYPRPADSERYLYEYYMHKAAESGELTAKYGQLSTSAASTTTR